MTKRARVRDDASSVAPLRSQADRAAPLRYTLLVLTASTALVRADEPKGFLLACRTPRDKRLVQGID